MAKSYRIRGKNIVTVVDETTVPHVFRGRLLCGPDPAYYKCCEIVIQQLGLRVQLAGPLLDGQLDAMSLNGATAEEHRAVVDQERDRDADSYFVACDQPLSARHVSDMVSDAEAAGCPLVYVSLAAALEQAPVEGWAELAAFMQDDPQDALLCALLTQFTLITPNPERAAKLTTLDKALDSLDALLKVIGHVAR